jgi:hypothetical protein
MTGRAVLDIHRLFCAASEKKIIKPQRLKCLYPEIAPEIRLSGYLCRGAGIFGDRSTLMIFFRKAGAVCATVTAGALMLGTVAAQATTQAHSSASSLAVSAAHWRQVLSRHYGAGGNYSAYEAVVAPAKNDAWVFGGTNIAGGGTLGAPVAEHWNGKRWSAVGLPPGVTGAIGAASEVSPSDIWAITVLTGYILHWNGVRWSVAKHLPGTGEQLTGVTAISATDIWVFGEGISEPGYGTWHFNGKTWRQQGGNAAGLAEASALSAANIWAIGGTTLPNNVIEHFNGKTWRLVTPKALSGLTFADIGAFSRTNIWVSAITMTGKQRSYLFHFNGKEWSRFAAPWDVETYGATPDGRGGLWMIALGPVRYYIVHRTAAGAWSRTMLSGSPYDLALLPHTTSVLAVGDKTTASDSDALIWAYGVL